MTERKEVPKKIEAHRRAIREHIEKAERYTRASRDLALKTTDRIKREIHELCQKAGIDPDQ